MKNLATPILVFLGITMTLMPVQAQDNRIEQINIVLLLDASSYSEVQWHGKTKFDHIRTALQHTYAELNKNPSWGLNLGLRIFGDSSVREKNNCVDYRLVAKLDWFEPSLLGQAIEAVVPKGKNCLAYAISSVTDDFPTTRPRPRNILICLVSSRDECTKDELITLKHVVSVSQLEAVYIIGVDLEKADQDYFKSFYSEIPGLFINTTSSESLIETTVNIVTTKCLQIAESQPPATEKTKISEEKEE